MRARCVCDASPPLLVTVVDTEVDVFLVLEAVVVAAVFAGLVVLDDVGLVAGALEARVSPADVPALALPLPFTARDDDASTASGAGAAAVDDTPLSDRISLSASDD